VTDPTLRTAAEGLRAPTPIPGPPRPPPNPQIQTPPPVLSWAAKDMSSGIPPDTQIAVSTTHVIVATQTIMGFFKKDGTPLGTIDYETFFKPLGLNDGTPDGSRIQSDPCLIFDAYCNRFWLAHGAGNGYAQPKTGLPNANVRGRIYVAVSQSEDPTGVWNLYWWDAVAEWHVANSKIYQLLDGADYPSIGIDPIAFHQTIVVSNPKTMRNYALLVTVAAKDLANGLKTSGSYLVFADPNGNQMQGVIQPAVHHGDTGGFAYFVGVLAPDQVLVWRLAPPLSPQPAQQTPKPVSVTVQPFGSPPDAPQKGAGAVKIWMHNLGNAPLKAVYRDGFLHVVANDARIWFKNDSKNLNSIRLVRLSMKEYPKIPNSGQGFIDRVFGMNNVFDDNPEIDHRYYGWPALEVNKNHDMVVVYARTGETIFPQVRFSVRYDKEADIRPSRLVKAGEATTKVGRWGDKGRASVDPQDDTSVWVAHQYAKDLPGLDYGIWVGKVKP
jgi:hypothetical protein